MTMRNERLIATDLDQFQLRNESYPPARDV